MQNNSRLVYVTSTTKPQGYHVYKLSTQFSAEAATQNLYQCSRGLKHWLKTRKDAR